MIRLLEHVNLVYGSREQSEAFFLRGLGCALDRRRASDPRDAPRGVIWANVGVSQFHVPSPGSPQRLPGHVALGYRAADLGALRERLRALQTSGELAGTAFSFSFSEGDEGDEGDEVTGPQGSRFRPVALSDEAAAAFEARGAHPGPKALGVGLLHVEWPVPPGQAAALQHFYSTYLRAETELDAEAGVLRVSCGPQQSLVFRETAETEAGYEYDGHHICIYVDDFAGCFQRLHEAGKIFTNPLFDLVNGVPIADTLPKALDTLQFRTLRLTDEFQLEHEVRCVSRPGCPLAPPPRPDHVPVLVVGGGPVGLAAGVALDAAGVSCLVVDPHLQPEPQPKGQTISYHTMEHLARWGLADRLRERVPLPDVPKRQFYVDGVGGSPRRLATNALTHFEESAFTPGAPPRLPQNLTQEVLLERLREPDCSAQLALGWTVTSVDRGAEDGAEEVRVTMSGPDGAERVVTANYVVGCDGGRSLVRSSLGIGYEGEGGLIPVLGIELRSAALTALLHERVGRGISYWVVGGPSGRRVSAVVTYSEQHWYVNVSGPGVAEVDAADEAAVRAALFESMEGEFECEVLGSYHWQVHNLTAAHFGSSAGRVFLAGDAAHLMSPTGGLNLNFGIEDCANLAWKLQGALSGWARPAVLDSYDAERRPWARRAGEYSKSVAVEMGRLERECPPRERPAEYEAALQPLWRGKAGLDLDIRYDASPLHLPDASVESEPWAGDRVAPVARAGHRAPYHPAVGFLAAWGFSVLLCSADPERVRQACRLSSVAASIDAPVQIVDLRDAPGEPEAVFGPVALVRPDGVVAWTARGTEVTDLVEVWRRLACRS